MRRFEGVVTAAEANNANQAGKSRERTQDGQRNEERWGEETSERQRDAKVVGRRTE